MDGSGDESDLDAHLQVKARRAAARREEQTMEPNLLRPRHPNSSMLAAGVGLGGLAAAAALIFWLDRERRRERRPGPKKAVQQTGPEVQMSRDIQEQPESTIGRKPGRLREARSEARSEAGGEAGGEPFARARARREEAEESDVGAEIRAREEAQQRADEEKDNLPLPDSGEPLPR